MRKVVVAGANAGRGDARRNNLHSLRGLLLLLRWLRTLLQLKLLILLRHLDVIDIGLLRAIDLLLLLRRLHERLVIRERAILLTRQIQIRAERGPAWSIRAHRALGVRHGTARQQCHHEDRS